MKDRSRRGIIIAVFVLAPLSALSCSTSPNGSSAGVSDASAAIREDTDEIPCAPRFALETVCQQCHALRPRSGAPFPLVRRSDVVARTYQGTIVRELMIEQLEAHRMPLAPVTIDPADREALLEWLHAGAPAVSARSCPDTGSSPDASDGAPSAPVDAGPDSATNADLDASDASVDADPPEAEPPP
jgi:hypothetical protein